MEPSAMVLDLVGWLGCKKSVEELAMSGLSVADEEREERRPDWFISQTGRWQRRMNRGDRIGERPRPAREVYNSTLFSIVLSDVSRS